MVMVWRESSRLEGAKGLVLNIRKKKEFVAMCLLHALLDYTCEYLEKFIDLHIENESNKKFTNEKSKQNT